MLAAVQHDGIALAYAAADLQSNREAAHLHMPHFRFLQRDDQVALAAVARNVRAAVDSSLWEASRTTRSLFREAG